MSSFQFVDAVCLTMVIRRRVRSLQESGDLSYAIRAGLLSEEKIFTLGRLINQSIRPSRESTSFFKSVGMALFDLLVAEEIYRLARELGAGHEIDIN